MLWTTMELIDPRWFIVISLSSIVFAVMSSMVLSRRMLFLAGSLPHSALLSALLSIIIERTLGLPSQVGSLIMSVALISLFSLMISRGLKTDVATAIFLSMTVSLTAISLYYILTKFPIAGSVWSYLVGDPLLVTWEDVIYTAIISSITLIMIIPFLKEQALIGIDRDFAKLSGVNVSFYDAIAVISLAIGVVGMLRVVGFILEHVMILLPGVIAASIARSYRSFLIYAFIISLIGGLGGLALSIMTSLAPSGCTGLLMLSFYILAIRRGR